ncbi:hypothetical protein Metvu_0333 [Methanocaldococcus vulcanius M7]|uniref:Uncharacterized protein n=1 Tax=Methanocaldococcus vulcanius (strain ATCC 700851 / DSM 12094 / M7) TaxID=579137 RepID=C9RF48_METVM|nr:hypothetical protein [Methanocaldococcus vulcanius]ACX72200.1 hypothetical protein Metvu_0333 [Methanocaldococcus vulcanius M7]
MDFESIIFLTYLAFLFVILPFLMDVVVYMKFKDGLGLKEEDIIMTIYNFVRYRHEKILGFRSTIIIILADIILAIGFIICGYYLKFNIWFILASIVIYTYVIYLIRCKIYSKFFNNIKSVELH